MVRVHTHVKCVRLNDCFTFDLWLFVCVYLPGEFVSSRTLRENMEVLYSPSRLWKREHWCHYSGF